MPRTHAHAVARVAVLIICVLIYLLTSSTEVVMVKAIYDMADMTLPIYCAWLINSYVLIEAPIYALYVLADMYERTHKTEHQHDEIIDHGDHSALVPCTRTTCVATHSHEPPEPIQHHRYTRLFQYSMIGAASTGVVLLKMFGIGRMAGSLYVMITNCSVIFNYILIRIFIPTRYLNHFHQLAAILTVIGVGLISASNYSKLNADRNIVIGSIAALAASFLSSCISVLSETVFTVVHDDKKKHQQSQGLLGLMEVTLANSTIPFILLIFIVPFLPEFRNWKIVWENLHQHHQRNGFVMMSFALALSKLTDRFSKFEIIHLEGSFFFTVMDTFSTALTAAFSYWFMNETFTYLFVWGCVILTIAGIVNGYAAYHEHANHPARVATKHHSSHNDEEKSLLSTGNIQYDYGTTNSAIARAKMT